MTPADLERELLAHAAIAARAGLGDDLALLVGLGRRAWPALSVDEKDLVRHLAVHARRSPERPLPPAERAADAFLACACAHRVPGAIDAIDPTLRASVERACARIDRSPSFVDEVAQMLRERLFFAPSSDTPPRIAQYAGHAPLSLWLTTSATHVALSLRRRRGDKPHEELRSSAGLLSATVGPDVEYLRRRYGDAFERALAVAIDALALRERAILRLNLVDRWSIDRIGERYGVSRATAARWLAGARDALFDETRRALGDAKLTTSEFASLAASLVSKLDLSITTQLAEDVPQSPEPNAAAPPRRRT